MPNENCKFQIKEKYLKVCVPIAIDLIQDDSISKNVVFRTFIFWKSYANNTKKEHEFLIYSEWFLPCENNTKLLCIRHFKHIYIQRGTVRFFAFVIIIISCSSLKTKKKQVPDANTAQHYTLTCKKIFFFTKFKIKIR